MNKNSKNTKIKTIVTHSGRFHADDVFAVAALKILLKNYRLKVVRTREPEIISEGDFVVDVGTVYNASQNKFDHHQLKGAGKRKNGIPYAAFGLVWKKYGEKISGKKRVAQEIDEKIVQFIDAEDNGVKTSKPIYTFEPFTISDLVSVWYPAWNEKTSEDEAFKSACAVAEKILNRAITRVEARIVAEKFVSTAYRRAKDKRIVVLPQKYPWQDFLINFPEPKFVISPQGQVWHVTAVKKDNLTFENRLSFPKVWGGKRDKELARVSGVEDAIFCHNNLFMAVTGSKESAIKLAEIALQ